MQKLPLPVFICTNWLVCVCVCVAYERKEAENKASVWNLFPSRKMNLVWVEFSSVQFSRSVVSDSLRPHGLQHSRPPCPSPTPRAYQTHIHWVGDAIQPSHPLSSPSPPTFNLSQHQGLFKWVSSLRQVAKVLQFQLQHQSFQWIFRTDFLGLN